MKYVLFVGSLLLTISSRAQELFVFTEPASNMATKSLGLRLDNYVFKPTASLQTNYLLIPEIMFGVSKNFMVHGDLFFQTQTDCFALEGGSLYLKYRIYSSDEVQQHFRIALFSRMSTNNGVINQQSIDLYGFNSGFEAGIVATQLLHKYAFSSGLSMVDAQNNANNKFPNGNQDNKAINLSISLGKLLLPKQYLNYRQTNVNLMIEFLSQLNLGSDKYYFDAAPSIQCIFNSQGRLDLGYRTQLIGNLNRSFEQEIFIRLEYNFFNL